MKIILVNPRGFCAGVLMAIDVVDQLLDILEGEELYVYHEIVHNQHVVNRFRTRGVRFVNEIEEVPEGSIVVFSAHGVSPRIRMLARERGLHVIDATCPLVTKVHAEARRYASQGYQILLIGHAEHQEIIGTRGEAPDAIQVIEKTEDIPSLAIQDPDKLVYLTQTTLSIQEAGRIISALQEAFPSIRQPPSDDICYATTNRQNAVQRCAQECDLVLVIGSKNSSNSVRLAEMAAASGTTAYRIDGAEELRDAWFENCTSVLITAGASAPEDLVQDLIRKLVDEYEGVVEVRMLTREEIEFGLPSSLKTLMRERGIDPSSRSQIVMTPEDTAAWLKQQEIPHHLVDLTSGMTG